jgi:putative RNA 2'-phosphotransferase
VRTSKFLSLVLRHKPETIGLSLDTEGWAEIDALIAGARRSGKHIDMALIKEVVAENDKKRFSISDDGLRIRAVQGHTTSTVAMTFEERMPPTYLYHGTASRFMDSINKEGLKPGSRHHVHLSEDRETAISVGKRYGKPVVLRIDTVRMLEEGLKFYQADNGVWLAEHVSPEFLVTE